MPKLSKTERATAFLRRFIAETKAVEVSQGAAIPGPQLTAALIAWASAEGEEMPTPHAFGRALTAMGFPREVVGSEFCRVGLRAARSRPSQPLPPDFQIDPDRSRGRRVGAGQISQAPGGGNPRVAGFVRARSLEIFFDRPVEKPADTRNRVERRSDKICSRTFIDRRKVSYHYG